MWINCNSCDTYNSKHYCQQDEHYTQDVFLFKYEKQTKDDENQTVYKEDNDHL